MKVLITGGAGFIGSRLALRLAGEGHDVTVLDNFLPQVHGDQPERAPLYEQLDAATRLLRGDVTDRETYNQLDNDLRVERVLAESDGAAAASLRALWTSGSEAYPPDTYGEDARLEVEILSITLISANRAQVRLRKRLSSPRGSQTGLFTATLMFAFRPEERRSIDEVWQNPFGFTVTEYAIRSDRLEE